MQKGPSTTKWRHTCKKNISSQLSGGYILTQMIRIFSPVDCFQASYGSLFVPFFRGLLDVWFSEKFTTSGTSLNHSFICLEIRKYLRILQISCWRAGHTLSCLVSSLMSAEIHADICLHLLWGLLVRLEKLGSITWNNSTIFISSLRSPLAEVQICSDGMLTLLCFPWRKVWSGVWPMSSVRWCSSSDPP